MSSSFIKDSLLTASQQLAEISDTPGLDAEVLLAHVLNKTRSYLFTWPDIALSESEMTEFQRMLALRKTGYPIAYITQQKEFWSLPFKVTPDVLIPRPDTEVLIEITLKLLPKNEVMKIVDLGTGSGAIAIALAHECPKWQVYATDQSLAALNIAKYNALHNKVNVEFNHGNWHEALPTEKFHAIISNPPYIADDDSHLKTAIRFEPKSALVACDHGYADLAKIIHDSRDYLLSNGYLLLEHGYDQAEKVSELMTQAGYHNISQIRDLSGHVRISYGQL